MTVLGSGRGRRPHDIAGADETSESPTHQKSQKTHLRQAWVWTRDGGGSGAAGRNRTDDLFITNRLALL